VGIEGSKNCERCVFVLQGYVGGGRECLPPASATFTRIFYFYCYFLFAIFALLLLLWRFRPSHLSSFQHSMAILLLTPVSCFTPFAHLFTASTFSIVVVVSVSTFVCQVAATTFSSSPFLSPLRFIFRRQIAVKAETSPPLLTEFISLFERNKGISKINYLI